MSLRGAATLLVVAAVVAGCAAQSQLTRGAHATPGDRIIARRCTGCHAGPNPAAMTRADWLDALQAMHDHVRLPAADWDTLAAMAEMPPSPGAEAR